MRFLSVMQFQQRQNFCCMRAYKLTLPAAYMLLKQQRQHEETRSYFLEHVYWITMNYNEKPTVNESRKHEMIHLLSFRGFI